MWAHSTSSPATERRWLRAGDQRDVYPNIDMPGLSGAQHWRDKPVQDEARAR